VTSPIAGLYAITPDLLDTDELLRRTRAALSGGARVLQYRNKTVTPALQLTQAHALQKMCVEFAVPLIINDSVELAVAIGAAGVHLGGDDGDLAAARARLGPDRLLGASCYDRIELAHQAIAAGADHVAFGSFFASSVKPGAVRPPIDLIQRAKRELGVPTVAIGGITTENAPQLLAAGVDAIAVISALFAVPDIERAAREFQMLFDQPLCGSRHEEKSKAL